METKEQSSLTNINSIKKNKLMYTKKGIKSLKASQVMNLEYETLRPGPNQRQSLINRATKSQAQTL